MKKFVYILLLLAFLALLLSGCAHKGAPTEEQVTAQGDKLNKLARSKTVEELDGPYLGGRAIPIANDSTALGMRVTLRKKGSLSSIATTLSDMIRIPIQVATADPEPLDKKTPSTGKSGDLDDLLALPSSGGSSGGGTISVSYEGTLRGLLDNISTQSGFGWDYNAKTNTITFARFMIRTFTLLSAPGEINYSNQITNKSKESQSGNIGNSTNINNTVSTSDTSAQTAQTNTTKLKFDVWKDTEAGVKALLSKSGSVVMNQAAGTLTVRDHPENIRQVSTFIDDMNSRLGRQVALNVQVWSLEITDDTEAGLDLQLMFANKDVSVVAGSLTSVGGLNTATATIVSGKLKNSSGVLKALKQWGNATQVTSGGGLVMSNQPVPVLAVTRTAYLAGASTNTTQYGQTAQITPGEVTTGFAMTIVPHILDQRRLILQYNINLSSLDKMEEFKTEDLSVQLPKVSTRAFAQRTRMQMGQTLVLAGYQQVSQGTSNGLGLFNASRSAKFGKTLLVITIEVESANDKLED